MSLIFKEEGHLYESIEEDIKWTSVTSFIGMFKPKFDAKAQAKKSAKNKKSKWYGMTEKEILTAWDNESKRAITLGNFYHNQRESDLLNFETIQREGVEVPIVRPLFDEASGAKIAPVQKIDAGVYPEHFVYLKSSSLCGQADLVEVVNGRVNITDYKTNKEIKKEGFKNWEGISAKMYNPVNHLDDCNFNHYSLQMSIYMYIILKHNPKLKPGKLTLQHVKFKQLGTDKNGYPINEHINGEPVLEEVIMYDVPYLKSEVKSLIKWWEQKNDH
jgi:ATP-dependent exoDNAse (exonuclease V) beta subunit